MKATLLVGALIALCVLSQGVQLPEEGRRLSSTFGGRAAAPSKATSLLQSKDEHVNADDEVSEDAEASSAAEQDGSTESTEAQESQESEEAEEASATADATHAAAKSEAAAEATAEAKSEDTGRSLAAGKSQAGKKKKRAGLFSLVKAQADIYDMNKRLDKLKWNLETSQNKSGRCHWKRVFFARRVAEVRAEREFRKKAKGKHLVLNETLAKARRAAGNSSTVGLWIITDDPFTREDEDREKFQRSVTRMKKSFENVTQFEESVKKYTELEDLYTARAAFYLDQINELNETLQAAISLKEEAKQNLRPKRRQQAKEQPLV